MEIGYSILLGEHLAASAIAYGDCAWMQIVCPACSEPVFKGIRNMLGAPVHYLSHYREGRAYDTDCELRVRTVGNIALSGHDRISRDQRLSYFLRRFTALLSRDPYLPYPLGMDKTHRETNRAKVIRMFRQVHYDNTVESGLLASEDIALEADLYISEMESLGQVPKTEFSILIQKRIARDILISVHTEPQRPNHAYLFTHSLLLLRAKLEKASSADNATEAFTDNFLTLLENLLSGQDALADTAMVELRHLRVYPPFVTQPQFGIDFLATECTHEMIGTLIPLPYFDLLREFVDSKQASVPRI